MTKHNSRIRPCRTMFGVRFCAARRDPRTPCERCGWALRENIRPIRQLWEISKLRMAGFRWVHDGATPVRMRAFTLVELLVVLGAITVLAALTLPLFKDLVKDQKMSQTARVVQGYCEAVRAKAMASGRRTALILERLRYDDQGGIGAEAKIAQNSCVRLSMGEVFPPYEGDWAGATGTLVDTSGDGYPDVIRIAIAQAASLMDTSVSPPVSSGLVSIGDSIEFGDRQQGFVITANPIAAANAITIAFANPPLCTWGYPMGERMWGNGLVGADVRFRIHRKPSKSLSGGVILPRGTCIDLSGCGTGLSGREFATDMIAGGTNHASQDFGQVYIVFGPRGNVEVAYFQTRDPKVISFARVFPTGIFHLLVGRTDQVFPDSLLVPFSGGAQSERDDVKANLMDPGNFWVSINPYSGSIYSSSVSAPVIPTDDKNMPDKNKFTVPYRTAQARQFATIVLNRGGS